MVRRIEALEAPGQPGLQQARIALFRKLGRDEVAAAVIDAEVIVAQVEADMAAQLARVRKMEADGELAPMPL